MSERRARAAWPANPAEAPERLGAVAVATWAGTLVGPTVFFIWVGRRPNAFGLRVGLLVTEALVAVLRKWVDASIFRVAVVWLNCFAAS